MFGPVRATGKAQLHVFGIPVRIEPVFFIIVLLLGLGPGADATLLAGWLVIVLLSILLHELAHAVAFLAFGSKPSIVLHGLGGVTTARSPRRRWQSVVVSLAGPLVPLVLVGPPAILLSRSDWAAASDHREILLEMVVWVNVWWGLVNLLPIVPLDGGHVAEAFLGPRWARVLTIGVAVPIAVYAFQQQLTFGALLAGLCAFQAWQQLRAPARTTTAADAGPPPPWIAGARLALTGQSEAAVPVLVDAALAGPPPRPALVVIADAGLAPAVATRLLAIEGERPAVAVAEMVGGLLSADRPHPASHLARLLTADARSPALQEWASQFVLPSS